MGKDERNESEDREIGKDNEKQEAGTNNEAPSAGNSTDDSADRGPIWLGQMTTNGSGMSVENKCPRKPRERGRKE